MFIEGAGDRFGISHFILFDSHNIHGKWHITRIESVMYL